VLKFVKFIKDFSHIAGQLPRPREAENENGEKGGSGAA
jgi:hypothetical protein